MMFKGILDLFQYIVNIFNFESVSIRECKFKPEGEEFIMEPVKSLLTLFRILLCDRDILFDKSKASQNIKIPCNKTLLKTCLIDNLRESSNPLRNCLHNHKIVSWLSQFFTEYIFYFVVEKSPFTKYQLLYIPECI